MHRTVANPADLADLRQRILATTPADQPRWGQMSLHQAICHMTDALLYTLNQRVIHTRIKSALPAPIYKRLALYFPRRWPQGVPTTPEMEQGVGGTSPSEFEADQKALLDALQSVAGNRGNWPPHPIFAEMTTREWHRWAWLHTDHHLRQFGR